MSAPQPEVNRCPSCGKPVPAETVSGPCPTCLLAQGTEFKNLAMATVREVQVQVQPLHWIEFRDVALTASSRR